ncbi:MAG: helix-turn-helix transcriptional regulator [Candidatus Hydrogenedentes bacterium]|nr:helix-turn-helix transcriptional regulator [Candidatus Hydrogenedentota bacterium]
MSRSVFTEAYAAFRTILIDARNKAGLRQVEVAQKIKRPQSFVSKYESGERRLDVIEFLEIAKVLGINAEKVVRELGKGLGGR